MRKAKTGKTRKTQIQTTKKVRTTTETKKTLRNRSLKVGQKVTIRKRSREMAKSAGPTWSEFWKVWSGKKRKSKRNCD